MPYSFNKKGIFPAGMVSFARPGARSGLGSVPVSRRRFSGPLSSALLNTSTHVFFSNPVPVLQSASLPVILSAAKDLFPRARRAFGEEDPSSLRSSG